MRDIWYLDELFVMIQGRQQYLWRAVDQDGDVIDILVQSRRDRRRPPSCQMDAVRVADGQRLLVLAELNAVKRLDEWS
jgi:hypothetical protein